ncbi:MAG: NUDIX domain-containing protein [Pseudomonadota bacterium]
MKPMFFFGSLRDRELLEVVLDRAVDDADLSAAWAQDHATLQMQGEPYPWLAAMPGSRAEGVVVAGLSPEDIERLEYFEEAEYGLAPIVLETASGPVEAVYFASTGKLAGKDQSWDFAKWQRESRAVAIEEARELMAHLGLTPIDRIDDIWDGIKIRAVMRARAKAETPVTGQLRPARTPDDVQSLGVDRPYTRFFAMEEHRLRHRRFDGSWSPEIMRAAVTSGDAVTVVPYDADRDAVLLIEQFRAPMFARGDACPWGIEAIAGRIDKETSAEAAARREAHEEAGLTLGAMEVAAAYYSSPGFAAEHLTSFIGQADLSHAGGQFGLASENEDIRAFTVALDEALDAIDTGEINIGPAILSLLWLARNRDRLRDQWATQG